MDLKALLIDFFGHTEDGSGRGHTTHDVHDLCKCWFELYELNSITRWDVLVESVAPYMKVPILRKVIPAYLQYMKQCYPRNVTSDPVGILMDFYFPLLTVCTSFGNIYGYSYGKAASAFTGQWLHDRIRSEFSEEESRFQSGLLPECYSLGEKCTERALRLCLDHLGIQESGPEYFTLPYAATWQEVFEAKLDVHLTPRLRRDFVNDLDIQHLWEEFSPLLDWLWTFSSCTERAFGFWITTPKLGRLPEFRARRRTWCREQHLGYALWALWRFERLVVPDVQKDDTGVARRVMDFNIRFPEFLSRRLDGQ